MGLYTLLLAGGIMWGYNEYQDYKYEKSVDAKVLANMKYKFDDQVAQIEF
jgi:hypothetical protein